METSAHLRLLCIFSLTFISLTTGETDGDPGHVTGNSDSHVRDPLEYVDRLLKEKYGLDVDFEDGGYLVTTSPEDELPQKDTTGDRKSDRILTMRSSSSFTSPALMYNPTTLEEVPEEVDEVEPDEDLVGDDPVRLQNLVNKLHKHVKASQTSQIRTRSVLTVIQERQDKQEQDLGILKNEISKVRREAHLNRQVTTALKSLVGDNAWAVNDLKVEQRELRSDFDSMKSIQEEQNATQNRLMENTDRAEEDVAFHQDTLDVLESELSEIKRTVKEDRKSVNKIVSTFRDKFNRLRGHRVRENRINSTPTDGDGVGEYTTTEPPNTARTADPVNDGYFEELLQTIKDQKEKIREAMGKAEKAEDRAKKQLKDFSQKMSSYEAEVSKIYTMFFNLSLQQSQMENQILKHQQHRSELDVRELQHSFINFTHHVLNLEQLHGNNFANTSVQNQREMSQINNLLDDHSSRLVSLEHLVSDYHLITQNNFTSLRHLIHRTNRSSHDFQDSFRIHHSNAKTIFEGVDEKLDDFQEMIKTNDNRLAHVEVVVLNTTLQDCQKKNLDHMQDMKLSDFNSDIAKLDDTVDLHDGQISRMDRGLSRLFQQTEAHASLVKSVLTQIEALTGVVPEVHDLALEVQNLVHDLPIDCADIQARLNKPSDGAYLIRPAQSVHSTRCYCEFEPESANHTKGSSWTVVQRRVDGSVSFARTWDEYKDGFGDVNQEFWIGNEKLNFLTSQGDYELQLDMWDLEGHYWWAHYDVFRVDTEGVNFRLNVDGYTGNSTDALRYSNHMPFSTIDMDNDVSSTHCARFYTAGWWYKHCHYSNLNGRYTVGVVWFNHETDEWIQLKKSVMKIKAKDGIISNLIDEND